MKAIVYTAYGPPDVLHVAEVNRRDPKDNEVLIRVRAAEATKADCELRSFRFPVKWFWVPLRLALGIRKPRNPILGGYFAGEIDSVGRDVSGFREGDHVFGTTGLDMGAYGEYLALSAKSTIVPKPSNLSFEEAAAIPLGGLNALHFMRRAEVRKGEKVLVNGAGGSIGLCAVQIAKAMGSEVTGVDSGAKEKVVRSVGADHFIDYTTEDFSSGGRTYDVIFDMVARKSYTRCVRTLAPKGRYLMGNPRISDMLRAFLTSAVTDKSVIFAFAMEKKEELFALKEMIESGKLRPVIDRVYRMDEAAEAHRRVETEQRLGMVVISMDTPT